jgi:CRISPR-associated protein Csm3
MPLQLQKIQKLHGELELMSGLRIGASEGEIRIGGVDNQVIRHPYTDEPYIPGSSLKGKVRSLLEWLSGAVKPDPLSYKHIEEALLVRPILQLFGVGGGDQLKPEQAAELGPTRLAFWDAPFTENGETRSGGAIVCGSRSKPKIALTGSKELQGIRAKASAYRRVPLSTSPYR